MIGWFRRAVNACTPDSERRETGWDAENERTRAFVELVAVERRIEELEVRRASLQREFRDRTREVQGGRR